MGQLLPKSRFESLAHTRTHTYVQIPRDLDIPKQFSTHPPSHDDRSLLAMVRTRGINPNVSYDEDAFLETHDRNLAEQGEVWNEGRLVRPRGTTSTWPEYITWLKPNGHANPGAGRVVVSCLLWIKQNIDAITPDPELDDDADIQWQSWDCWSAWPEEAPKSLFDVKTVFQTIFDEFDSGDLACEPDDETCLLARIFENAENIMGAAQNGTEATDRTELLAAIDDLCHQLASAYMFEYTM